MYKIVGPEECGFTWWIIDWLLIWFIIIINNNKKKSTLSRTVRSHFLRKKFFLVFCLGQLRGLPNNIRHSSRKKTKRSCEVWPSGGDKVEFVKAEERRKVEGLRKIPRRWKEKYLLGCSGLELFPWPLLEFIFIVKEVLGVVFDFVGSCTAKVPSPPVGS